MIFCNGLFGLSIFVIRRTVLEKKVGKRATNPFMK